jgi:putative acetyltransferase
MIINTESPNQPEVLSMLARDVDGGAIGCAALVNRDGYGEIKRMFVDEAKRGLGTGRKLLEHIAMFAAMAAVRELKLETGIHQPEAIALYERFGFVRCGPFGDYQPDPLSVFMEKRL